MQYPGSSFPPRRQSTLCQATETPHSTPKPANHQNNPISKRLYEQNLSQPFPTEHLMPTLLKAPMTRRSFLKYKYKHNHKYTYTYIHTYMHAYMHTCMHACMHAYILMYRYTELTGQSTEALTAAAQILASFEFYVRELIWVKLR